MIHRIALLLGGLVAAAILVFGIVRGDPPVTGALPDDALGATASDAATTAGPRTVVDTVYIAAPRAPKVIEVTRRAKPSRHADPAPARQANRPRGDDDEHDGREHDGREHDGREHDDHERDDD